MKPDSELDPACAGSTFVVEFRHSTLVRSSATPSADRYYFMTKVLENPQ
jgi:hypothetical protein